jgi:serine/threonine protein kinase
MRAPEVWAGYGCRHVSDVYSVGATIISWLQPGVLGSHDVKPPIFADAWCIAKMIKLVETENEQTVDPPADFASNVKSMYELGRVLLTQPEDEDDGSMHVPARPLREVLWRLGTTPEVKTLLPVLLAPNFQNRLSAGQVLTSKEYKALQHSALDKLNVPENNPHASAE